MPDVSMTFRSVTMQIRFRCPHCGRKYKTDERFAGSLLACHRCGQAFKVPKAASQTALGEGFLTPAQGVVDPNTVDAPPLELSLEDLVPAELPLNPPSESIELSPDDLVVEPELLPEDVIEILPEDDPPPNPHSGPPRRR